MAECDIIDLATVMIVVVEVLCDTLWPFTAFKWSYRLSGKSE